MQTLLAGLEAAFGFFGGVPRELLFDQMKSVIVRDLRGEGGRVTENAEFLRFAAHWSLVLPRFGGQALTPKLISGDIT